MSPPRSPQETVRRSETVRQRMRQANWPFPNLLEETIDWNQMYCTRLNLVRLKRMTGKADRLAMRARARRMERTATFWLL